MYYDTLTLWCERLPNTALSAEQCEDWSLTKNAAAASVDVNLLDFFPVDPSR